MEIARRYTDKVIEAPRRGMCELHRVDAIRSVDTEWVLQIDADEYLSDDAIQKIPSLLNCEDVDGYRFLWKLWNGADYFTSSSPHKSVLFRKSKMYYIVFPHTEMNSIGTVRTLDLVLEHKPTYNNYTFSSFSSKWRRWINVHAEFIFKDNYDHFNAGKDALGLDRRRMKHIKYANPVLAPLWFAASVFKALFKHKYFRNRHSIKVALLQGLYAFFLCLRIYNPKINMAGSKWHSA